MGIKLNYRRLLYGREWYDTWINEHELYDYEMVMNAIDSFQIKPLISIILPVYNVKNEYLVECIESVKKQWYPFWELCIADDHSSDESLRDTLNGYAKEDKRIKLVYRLQNGHISTASNTALQLATGSYTALLDNDDVLAPFALYEVASTINSKPEADLLFSDEDKLLNGKRVYPFFKKGWDRNLLFAVNYISHLAVYKTELLKSINGFRIGFEGSQDWDLTLRFTEYTNKVVHIPKVLYHWRMIETSTSMNESKKDYIKESQRNTIREAKKRKSMG